MITYMIWAGSGRMIRGLWILLEVARHLRVVGRAPTTCMVSNLPVNLILTIAIEEGDGIEER